jgi:hypothetical protein
LPTGELAGAAASGPVLACLDFPRALFAAVMTSFLKGRDGRSGRTPKRNPDVLWWKSL